MHIRFLLHMPAVHAADNELEMRACAHGQESEEQKSRNKTLIKKQMMETIERILAADRLWP